ncbi:hypothetical protein CPLU01_06082 [Colletotrichum plurivorum]|uniref:Uncharacterized protein n=1 Tax=Colletotrichum plurivorum TaxID=2175906 RepID=A0A8H6KJM5_9PEZI|nr:hypothetical protein CPLU01_06082 [Colletotrichum plurivorum]
MPPEILQVSRREQATQPKMATTLIEMPPELIHAICSSLDDPKHRPSRKAVLIHNNDIELFVKAAATLRLDTPQPLLRQARPAKQQCYFREEKDEILEWLTVLMAIHAQPAPDRLQPRRFDATPRGPLLPKLDEVLIEHHIFGHLWSLASSMAPNLTKLQVHHQFNVPRDLRFENSTTLSIEDSLFTEMELKNVLEGFPRLEALRYSWSDQVPSQFWVIYPCLPSELLDCLQPFKAQLKSLAVNFGSWTWPGSYDNKPSSQWIAYLSRFESLTHLGIQAHLFSPLERNNYFPYCRLDPNNVGSLVRMLPKGLESVDLGRLGGDSVPLLAKTIKERCPGLRLVTCIYVGSDVDGEPTEEEAKEALVEEGIELGVLSRCGFSSDNSSTVDGGNEAEQE